MSKKKTNKKKKSGFIAKHPVIFTLVVSFLVVNVAFIVGKQQINMNKLNAEIEATEQQIAAEKDREKDLEEEKKKVNTPEWIEAFARSEMGYAAPDEVVYIDPTVSD